MLYKIIIFHLRLYLLCSTFCVHSLILTPATDTTAIETERISLIEECDVVMELMRKAIQENAHLTQDQVVYDKANSRLMKIEKLIENINAKRLEIYKFLKNQGNHISEFDDELWLATIQQVKVVSTEIIILIFKDGSKFNYSISL